MTRFLSTPNPITGPSILNSVDRDPSVGSITLEGTGPARSFQKVYLSSDLQRWWFLGHGLADSTGAILFVDNPPTAACERFYRFSE